MRQARLVLTVSDFASADLTRYLRIPSERIRVAVEAPAPAFQPVQDANRLEILTRRLGIPAGARGSSTSADSTHTSMSRTSSGLTRKPSAGRRPILPICCWWERLMPMFFTAARQ